jgi:hypothetical protein
MSWELILVASSVLSAGAQYISGKQQAAAGEARANIEAKQHKTNSDLAKLQAMEQETDRRLEFAALEATNNASVNYDPFTSASYAALGDANASTLDRDIGKIQLMGRINAERHQQSMESSLFEAGSFRQAGRMAWLAPTATLLKGGYEAGKIHIPKTRTT